jgi:hypothetical protein
MRITKENLNLLRGGVLNARYNYYYELRLHPHLELEVMRGIRVVLRNSLAIHLRNSRVMNDHVHNVHVNDVE